jgi:hypothetical protein
MEIPLYVSGRDHDFSWKDDGTQRTKAFDQRGANPVCNESYNIRNHKIRNIEVRSLQTNGQAAGLSSARGAVAGVLLGATLWGAILVLVGIIKL